MTTPVRSHVCVAASADGMRQLPVPLASERECVIHCNGSPYIRLQVLAQDLADLAVGLLYSEGVISRASDIDTVTVNAQECVEVTFHSPADDSRPDRSRGSSGGMSVCLGLAGAIADDALASGLVWTVADLLRIGQSFEEHAGLYAQTRFVHSAALADQRGVVHVAQDVGRHNALDKAIGWGLRVGADFSRLVMCTSGRLSLEMVSRAARAGVCLCLSPAAASSEAVGFAQRVGLTLCGSVRAAEMLVYSRAERVTIVAA